MSDSGYGFGAVEPTAEDEQLAAELGRRAEDAALRAKANGDERCGNCQYYLDSDAPFAYCWQPKLRVLVDADWWCQWWEEAE